MDILQAIHGRRSIRAYRPEPVDRALIEDILWAAAQAPTPPPSGDEPWRFVVIEGAERIEALGVRALRYAQDHPPPGQPWTWPNRPGFRVFWGAPVVVLICARTGHPEAAFDCCRAGQNLMLAALAHGLGSCWVGSPMPWLASAGVGAELGLPAGFDPAAAFVLGHPAEQPPGEPRAQPPIIWCSGIAP